MPIGDPDLALRSDPPELLEVGAAGSDHEVRDPVHGETLVVVGMTGQHHVGPPGGERPAQILGGTVVARVVGRMVHDDDVPTGGRCRQLVPQPTGLDGVDGDAVRLPRVAVEHERREVRRHRRDVVPLVAGQVEEIDVWARAAVAVPVMIPECRDEPKRPGPGAAGRHIQVVSVKAGDVLAERRRGPVRVIVVADRDDRLRAPPVNQVGDAPFIAASALRAGPEIADHSQHHQPGRRAGGDPRRRRGRRSWVRRPRRWTRLRDGRSTETGQPGNADGEGCHEQAQGHVAATHGSPPPGPGSAPGRAGGGSGSILPRRRTA